MNEPLSPQLRQALHDWRFVLPLLHEAAAKPGYYVDREYYRPSIYLQLSDLQNMRYMASLLALDGQDKAAAGDVRGAIQDINTRLVMARHAATEPLLIALLVSAGIQNNALGALQRLLERKNISAADIATLRIENGPSYRKLLERALRMEEAIRLTTFYQVDVECQFSRIVRYDGQEVPGDHPILESDRVFAFVHRLFLLPGELEVSRQISHEMHVAAGKPYGEAKPLWEQCATQARFHGGALMNTVFIPSAAAYGQASTRADATRQVARLGVAAYLYREKNGHFPEKLNDLAPDYILTLPTDPFDGKPMKWKRTDHGIVIYSVGPDMVDDGGAPFDPTKQTGDITFEVSGGKP